MNREKLINDFVEKMKTLYEDRLSSVFLYGSCAVGECENKFSDINLIVIIKDLNSSDLKRANESVKPFLKEKNPLPIFMDKDEWFNSSDVYAMEYSDIKDRNKILYGENLIDELQIEKKDVRFQCEQETKNLLIKLRQTYLGQSHDKNTLKTAIKMSSKTFLVIFRAVLKLLGETVPTKHVDVIKLFAEKINSEKEIMDVKMFERILEFRENPKEIDDKETEIFLQRLIDTTNYVLKYVDKL